MILRTCRLASVWPDVRRYVHASVCRYKKRKNEEQKSTVGKHKQTKVIEVWRDMTVGDLAQSMDKEVKTVVEVMNMAGFGGYRRGDMVIDNWNAIMEVLKLMRFRYKTGSRKEEKEVKDKDIKPRERGQWIKPGPRPPVVTIMGHVDHGKTTLLDRLRKTSVAMGEPGGITQQIGAFSVSVKEGLITFVDTPGHALFTAMRARGAAITDIIVLVVAADDGVMQQTKECIGLALGAGVPVVVAINKMDMPMADPQRVRMELASQGLVTEQLGGEVQSVEVSAAKGQGLQELLEAIAAQAELAKLEADTEGPVEASVLEARHDRRGPVASLLVCHGKLTPGAVLVAGTAYARVRTISDDASRPLNSALPSTPVLVTGWRMLPTQGDLAIQVPSEKQAKEIISYRSHLAGQRLQAEQAEAINSRLESQRQAHRWRMENRVRGRLPPPPPPTNQEGEEKELPRLRLVVKADAAGSIEAVLDLLATYPGDDVCRVDVASAGVGPVTHSDVALAATFAPAVIIAFATPVLPEAAEEAKQQNVPVEQHNVIYRLVEMIKERVDTMLPPKDEERVQGRADVLQEFLINEGKEQVPVAGCRVITGSVAKRALVRLERAGTTLYTGPLASLRRIKEEVQSVGTNTECGLRIPDPTIRFQRGDSIICFTQVKVPQHLNWDPF